MALKSVPDQNVADRVTVELREAIFSGDLAPGERLVERKLAERLGTSHIPVREALTRLTQEGLVERLPHRGARVAALTSRDLEEISSLRTLLEQFAVVRVQDAWDPAKEAKLRKTVQQMVQAAEKGSNARVFELDRRFHEQLWEMADHRMLMTLNAQLRSRITGFLRAANAALEPEARVAHARTHDLIVDAIAGGDPGTAQRVMAEHIGEAAARLASHTEDEAEPAAANG
ncbi:GntR family transcriptional regulator [Cellulosimicrobium funkei]|uniref:GntR family transcriptional regulator n=1 Tax=Cellulosimicrobium funkei TaxID=264251 RepID=UPI003757480E